MAVLTMLTMLTMLTVLTMLTILTTGELPNLFARDEVDAILGEVGYAFEEERPKEEPTAAKLWAFFLDRVRSHLHLVLCFSPVGSKFRNRARMFPGLINGCTVDWFLPWPQAALEEVAQSEIGKFEIDVEPEVKAQLIKHMAQTHQTVSDSTADYFDRYRRHVYVTPKSYLSFLQDYQTTYAAKHAAVNHLASSIIVGLDKLVQASSDVDVMKIELKEKEKGCAACRPSPSPSPSPNPSPMRRHQPAVRSRCAAVSASA